MLAFVCVSTASITLTDTQAPITFAADGLRPVALKKQLQLRSLLNVKFLPKFLLNRDIHFAEADPVLAFAHDLHSFAQLLG